MSDLMRYASALAEHAGAGGAPVHLWDPPYCGALDLVIRGDGLWVHEGTPIGRARLVRLFSTVLKREGDAFFLVTPAEKLKIDVEDAPFVAVALDVVGNGESAGQTLRFRTNVGDVVEAGAAHPISYRGEMGEGGAAPYVHVRGGLEARVARAVFYDLIELGETAQKDGEPSAADAPDAWFGVRSGGAFFPFAPARALADASRDVL